MAGATVPVKALLLKGSPHVAPALKNRTSPALSPKSPARSQLRPSHLCPLHLEPTCLPLSPVS